MTSEKPASTEEAVELYLDLRRRGAAHDPAAFAARHPELEPELSSALGALLALERATGAPAQGARDLPDRIGAFAIVREIGRGGMGVVLEAVEEPLGRRVALKVLPPESLSSSSARARFRREATLASRLDHSGIATIYAAGIEADQPWIAMRYVDGKTLARRVAEARADGARCVQLARAGASAREQVSAVASCIARVARALHSAHEQGVVHRDVKPSNVIVAPDGTPVLLDFGLATAAETDEHALARTGEHTLTRTGDVAGTPAYLAPENVSGERSRPDAQSDVYSLGVTLFECLALRRPFDEPTPAALYHAIVEQPAPSLRAQNRYVSRDLAVVAATAMERDRARRYRSAAALADDLEACVAGRPIAARPVPLSGRIARWARREPKQAALASLLACATLAAAVLAGTWWSGRSQVQAAEGLTRARDLEHDLQSGFGNLSTNYLDDADHSFVHALELEPKSVEALAGRALVRLKQRRDADVVAILKDAPPSPAFDALRKLASGELPELDHGDAWFASASAIEMFVDGMRLVRQKERSPPHDRPALAKLAWSRFNEAVARSRSARFFYHVERARAAGEANDEAAARAAAASLVTLWPEHERSLFTAGSVLSRYDPRAASDLLARASELDPGWGQPHQLRGNTLYFLEDYVGAERELRRALELNARDFDAQNSLALTLQALECFDDARDAYQRALRLRPGMWQAWANLGLMEVEHGSAADAETALRNALEQASRETPLRLALAQVLEKRGATREALAESEIGIGFDAHNAELWELVSRLQAALGKPERALDAALFGLEIDPKNAALAKDRDVARAALDRSHAAR